MLRMAVALLLLGPAQDSLESVTVPKAERAKYLPLVNQYREALRQLEEDPSAAIDACTGIIGKEGINRDYLEVRIRFENPGGGYTPFETFLPYQVRGRARLARARAISAQDRAAAVPMADGAVADLQHSVNRGAASSREHLEKAQELARGLKAAPPPLERPAASSPADQAIRELDALANAVPAPAPETVIQECDRRFEAVKGTPREAEWRRIRQNAAALKAISALRAVDAKTPRDPAAVIEMCDRVAADVKGSLFENEWSGIRKGAERDVREGINKSADALVGQLRELLTREADPEEILKACDAAAPRLKELGREADLQPVRSAALEARRRRFRERWNEHCSAGRFRTASKMLDEASWLEEKERDELRAQAQARCAQAIAGGLDRFLRGLRAVIQEDDAWGPLSRMSPAEFQSEFALPGDEESVVAHEPALEWARRFRATLEKARAAGDPVRLPPADFVRGIEALAEDAVAALALGTSGENRPFRFSCVLAFDILRLRLESILAEARGAADDRLDALKSESAGVLAAAREFRSRVETALKGLPDKGAEFLKASKLPERVDGLSRRVEKGFPVRSSRIGEIAQALLNWQDPKGVYGPSSLSVLEMHERELNRIWDDQGAQLSRGDRQRLATGLMIVAAMRHLLDGAKAETVAQRTDMLRYARQAAEAGGVLMEEVSRFGPKVRRAIELAKP